MTQSNTHHATVLVISSQVIDGQIGIQAIAPGLRAFGLGCIALPTTLLAAHPALMKRPLIVTDGEMYLGWGPEVRAMVLG